MVIVRAYRRKGKRRVVAVRRHNRGKLRQQGMSRDEAERKLYEHNSKKSATEKDEKKEEYLEELRDKRARFRQLKKHPKTPFVLNISDHNHDQDIKTFRTLVEAKRYTNKMLRDWERKWVKNENYTKSFGKMALSESTAVCVQDLVTGKQYIASASNQWE